MKYFDIHEMIEKSRLTEEIQVALDGVCDLHNRLHDIRNMNGATYLCFSTYSCLVYSRSSCHFRCCSFCCRSADKVTGRVKVARPLKTKKNAAATSMSSLVSRVSTLTLWPHEEFEKIAERKQKGTGDKTQDGIKEIASQT